LEGAKYYTSFFTFAARFWQCEGKSASYWRPCPRPLLPLEAVRASFSLVDLIVIPIPIGADKIFSHCESCKSCFLIGRLVELLTNQNGRFIPGLLRLGVLCEKNTEQ